MRSEGLPVFGGMIFLFSTNNLAGGNNCELCIVNCALKKRLTHPFKTDQTLIQLFSARTQLRGGISVRMGSIISLASKKSSVSPPFS